MNGNVPAYSTVDAQVSKITKSASFKLGGSNILNQYYRSYLGGPSVGGFYYISISYYVE